ncbi:MMPL family transporter [Sinimarinibacterium flocculans]|uniref:Putative RND superfamily exporter protein n=1 Tax=Sinimarinibacterium flocculans TaxID=985250 RepID=A0A318E0P8_9GAMM|nr:MMPL family transporter [Sinimarinibacterium flocculans]PXV63958.1 putative RND superfamily exporter protein [Sinimarinibacterium flocculans]
MAAPALARPRSRLIEQVATRPWLALAAMALASVLAVLALFDLQDGGLRLRVDPSLDTLVVPGIEAERTRAEVQRRFGAREQVVVVVRADDVFAPPVLDRIHALSQRLFALPGVARVQSLTRVAIPLVGDGQLEAASIGAESGADPQRLARLRDAALDNPLLRDQLVAADARATAIVVELAPGSDAERAAQGLPAAIVREADAIAGPGLSVHVTGAPVLRAATGDAVLSQLSWVVPAIVSVVMLFLAGAFRNLRGVLVPLATICLALLFTLAGFVAIGRPLNLVTSLVPPLVVTMSLAYCAHVLSEFEALLRSHPADTRSERTRRLLGQMAPPVALTAVATAIGVAALGISALPAVREFALLSVLGVLAAAALALLFVPAVLAYVPQGAPAARARDGEPDWFERLAARIGAFDIRRRRAILAVAALALTGSVIAASQVRIGDQFVGVFEPDARVRIDYEAANAALGGVTPLTILIDGFGPGVLTHPEHMQALARLQAWLRTQPEIGAVSGAVDHLQLLARTLGGDPEGRIPDERDRIEQLLFFGDSAALRQVLNLERSATLIHARVGVDRTEEVAALLDRLRVQLAALPEPLQAQLTGDAVLVTESVRIVTADQLQSIALALALIYACLALQFASWRVGLLATLPTLLQTAIYFGALGLGGVTLNATTSLVECLVLGLAIDDTIHYLARFNSAARQRVSESKGAVAALGAVMRPVTLTKAILGLGFIVLITGDLHNQVVFGWLAAGTLFVAWLVDLFVTPAFMSGVRIVTLWDSLRVDLGEDVQRTIPLLSGLKPREARIFALMANLQTVPAGTRLITEGESCGDGTRGDPAGDIYVVVDGRLEIFIERQGRKNVLMVQGRGAVIGEVGYFGQKRLANVDTLTETRLLRFDDADQERICRQYPRIAARVFLNLNRLQAERRATQSHLVG